MKWIVMIFIMLSLTSVGQAKSSSLQSLMNSCEQGSNKSCYRAGNILYNQKKRIQARYYFRLACKRKHSNSCIGAGNTYILEEMAGYSRGNSKKYYYRACELGNSEGCRKHQLSQMAGY